MASDRSVPIPFADAPNGTCRWCGEPITFGRVGARRWHDGREPQPAHLRDEGAVKEPACLQIYLLLSKPSATSPALLELAGLEYACAECGRRPEAHERVKFDVDHRVPLADGGEHALSNLQLLCNDPCHKAKTAREAGERAARRRAALPPAPPPPPDPQLSLGVG